MFTPKWISLKEAVDYIHWVEGGLRWVALEHLLQALRDQDVNARYASSLGPVTPTYWIDAARNPVHLRQSDYTEIGVRFEHVQRIWPMALAVDPNQIIPTQRERSATTVPTGEGDKEITPTMCHQANIDPSAPVMVPSNAHAGQSTLDWVPLSGAFKMLSCNASGLTEPERKLVICRWIADHKVDTLLTLATGRIGGFHIRVPAHLGPQFFDWEQSRPVKPWLAGDIAQRHESEMAGQFLDGEARDIALIELRASQLRAAIDEAVRRFDERAVWQVRELLALLINPDRARFGLLLDDDLRAAARYEHGRQSLTAVLYGLQQDRLIAHENGSPLPRIHWINKKPRDLLEAFDFHVFAEAAVAVWPELRGVPATSMQGAAILASRKVPDPDGGDDRLRPANDREVHKAIKAVYDSAEAAGKKPPNLKEIAAPVQASLQAIGYLSSGRRIQKLAEAPQHKGRRRRPGTTIRSEKLGNKA